MKRKLKVGDVVVQTSYFEGNESHLVVVLSVSESVRGLRRIGHCHLFDTRRLFKSVTSDCLEPLGRPLTRAESEERDRILLDHLIKKL